MNFCNKLFPSLKRPIKKISIKRALQYKTFDQLSSQIGGDGLLVDSHIDQHRIDGNRIRCRIAEVSVQINMKSIVFDVQLQAAERKATLKRTFCRLFHCQIQQVQRQMNEHMTEAFNRIVVFVDHGVLGGETT